MSMSRRTVLASTLLLGLAGCAGLQPPPPYPTKPVKIIVPYPVGNVADVFGRMLAEKLSQTWGQPVTVENMAGRVTVPGVNAVAKAPADGHTLLVHSISYAVDASLYTGLPFDPAKDLTAVAGIARQPFVLVASPSLGVKNVADLVALAKSRPLKFGSRGPTTQVHFVAEQFRRQVGFDASGATYAGVVDANAAVAQGAAAFWFPPVAGGMAGIREGKLVPLAVTGERRVAMLPQVPTMAEAGVRNMVTAAWFGVWAPGGVHPGIVDKVSRDVAAVLESPDVRDKLAKAGAEPMPMSSSQFSRFVRDETDASRRFIGELGIRPQAYSAPPK